MFCRGYGVVALAVCLLNIVVLLVTYPYLPEIIPYHWDIAGKVNSTGSKHIVFFMVLLPLLLYLFLLFIPRLDPKRDAYLKHTRAYSIVVLVLVTFMFLLNILVVLASLGYPVKIAVVMGILLFAIFIYRKLYEPNSSQFLIWNSNPLDIGFRAKLAKNTSFRCCIVCRGWITNDYWSFF